MWYHKEEGINVKLIFLCVAGSHLYGTNRPDSDLDLRGVVIEDSKDILGLGGFEQMQGNTALEYLKKNYGYDYLQDTDITLHGLKKFTRLLSDGNPNIIELLFAHNLLHSYDWDLIRDSYRHFLSKRLVPKFVGYIKSQHGRIKSRQDWLLNPPTKPEPKDYGMGINLR
jgi:predicted nucleotidyltransferase